MTITAIAILRVNLQAANSTEDIIFGATACDPPMKAG